MQLKEILAAKGSKVWSVRSSQTVADVVALLVANKIGALLVLEDDDAISGIISERDVMRVCNTFGSGWAEVVIRDVMTPRVLIVKPDDDVDYAMGLMTQNRIRHIPVMEDKKLIGVISIGDVVKAQLKETQYENVTLKDYMSGA